MVTTNDAIGATLGDAALLAEPARRALLDYVASTGREVGRDEAAKAAHVERPLAAFHLDKLVEAGFLEASFRRLSGRSGPGAGRPSKLYRRTAKNLDVSVPQRQYELLARLLARAVTAGGSDTTAHELARAARELGRRLAAEARESAGARANRSRLMREAERVLASYGFEPRRDDPDMLRLRNCPFDALALQYRDLVCGMNYELMSAFVDGLKAGGVRAVADRRPGLCCVGLRYEAAVRGR